MFNDPVSKQKATLPFILQKFVDVVLNGYQSIMSEIDSANFTTRILRSNVVFQYSKQWNQGKQNQYFLHLHLHVEPEQNHHHIVNVTLVIVSEDTEDFEDGEH
jgi:hypothetical protein